MSAVCAWAALVLVAVVAVVGGDKRKCFYYNLHRHPNFRHLPTDTCGENHADRIVGGQAATLGEYPWMARIAYKLKGCSAPMEFRCGGALITPNVVLTAAHCTTNLPQNLCSADEEYRTFYPYLVRLGEHDIRKNPDCEQGMCADPVQDIKISEVILHPRYNTPRLRNDLSIIKLRQSAVLNGWVNTLCLVAAKHLTMDRFLNQTGVVAGWGIVNPKTQEMSKELMKLMVPVVPIEQCLEAFEGKAKLSTRRQICAGGIKGQDSCAGDSGGPLFLIDETDNGPKYSMVGIVSFGFKKCADKPVPAVYTNVLYYGKWIMDNIV